MNDEQIKVVVAKYMASGLDRPRAFHKFRAAQRNAIIEWEDHLESLEQQFGTPLPIEWANVVQSVTVALARERAAIQRADQIEQSEWLL